MTAPFNRVVTHPFRLRTWTGVLALAKPSRVRPRAQLSRLEQAIMFHETELPKPPSTLAVDYIDATDRFHDGVLIVGLGTGVDAFPQLKGMMRHYTIEGCLGRATDTFTSEGSTIEDRSTGPLDMDIMTSVLEEKFRGEVILPLPPVKLLDERPKMDRQALRYFRREQEAPAVISHFDLVRKPYLIKEIYCSAFNLPNFTVEVLTSGNINPYGLVYAIAHELGTCGHATRSHIGKIGRFSVSECLSDEMLDDPRCIYNALCSSWGLWDTRFVSKKFKRARADSNRESIEREKLLERIDGDPRKRVAIEKLSPLMAKGALAREDCPPEAGPLREKLIGGKGHRHLQKVVSEIGSEFHATDVHRAPEVLSTDAAVENELSDADGDGLELEPLNAKKARRSPGISSDPNEFAAYRGGKPIDDVAARTRRELDGPGQHGRSTLRGLKTSRDSSRQVNDVLSRFSSVKDRLKEMHDAKRQRHEGGGVNWKSKYGV
eukprot:scpid69285/ scgid16981/ Probable tRNA pseudouridine synthase 1